MFSMLALAMTAGMEYFIHVKSNVLETLQSFQKKLGII